MALMPSAASRRDAEVNLSLGMDAYSWVLGSGDSSGFAISLLARPPKLSQPARPSVANTGSRATTRRRGPVTGLDWIGHETGLGERAFHTGAGECRDAPVACL
ncbi:hypothetical protein RS694_13440 [Rhodoferax saidenbachensis]|uniref:Uncharacterized protein n=1 Tax=Rhodoferax saidenbachensis TaxID=1484693 RepID=A0A1P8KBT6_9BURK|nr:hypothetical protein RS694_13440 [Rhodoferax saidenbachensis]